MMIVGLLACTLAVDSPDQPQAEVMTVLLEGQPLARRMSLDLRGVVPSIAEMDRVEAEGVDPLVKEWLHGPMFEAHLVDTFAEDWLLRVDELRVDESEFGLDEGEYAFTRALGDEPARLMARVAAEDRPFTEIVTADWTMVNSVLLQIEPVVLSDPGDPPLDASEWREARYDDGRPAGGVLMTSGLWLRYPTTLFNFNRARAAVLAKYLLCYDFLARPVHFDGITATTGEAIQAATQSEPSCLACHSGLDPLASTLFGFWPFEDKDGTELITYHPERERYGETELGLVPAYFGTPVDAAGQLGPLVARDPRFEMCVVTRAATRFWGRPPTDAEAAEMVELRGEFEANDLRYTGLIGAILRTDAYRVGGLTELADEATVEATRTRRLMSPLTMASAVEGLTGFRWTFEGWDQFDSDESGYRMLLGGADGASVRTPNHQPTVSRTLVIRRLAEAAASFVVDHDVGVDPDARRLVGTTEPDVLGLVAGSEALSAELAAIHYAILARRPSEAELGELNLLWATVAPDFGAGVAFATVVGLLIRDPEFWSY
jgi:hypothetical protein